MSEHEFLEIFREEANERLDSIVDTLLALESGRATPDAIDSLFRDAHTIKGAAGMVGLDEVRALAHAVEDILQDVRSSGEFPLHLVQPLLHAADALRAHVRGGGAPVADVVGELSQARVGSENGKPSRERATVRISADKLDRLLDLVGETALHRRRLEHALDHTRTEDEALSDELGVGERLLSELQEAAVTMRTRPLGSIAGGFPRAVRDAAAAEGKQVDLVVTGAETELDRVILDGLSEPIVHLLRNAVAHGLEKPAARKRAGKPQRGRVELNAEQRGGRVAVTVTDDGRGVSKEALAEAKTAGSLVAVLARAGYSTAEAVGDLSGRGVGLDAVKAYVEGVAGTLEIASEPGSGTAVTMLLPFTLALLDVLLVERGPHLFGVPLASVDEAVAVEATHSLAGRRSVELRGETVPLADLAGLAGGSAPAPPQHPPALVVRAGGPRVAVVCDRLLGEQEVVVKPLDASLGAPSHYLGATILGDGRIALLLDANALVHARPRNGGVQPVQAQRPATESPKLLVVEDSFTVRELQRSILEAAGYRVDTARNGKEALALVQRDDEIALVVTDVEMPEMDGFELTEAIRKHPERSSLPVIVVTTRASDEDRQRGIDAGADAYMVKRGFDQQAMLATVERLVGR